MPLLPQDEKFFDLLVDQAKIVLDASRLIADGLQSSGQPDFLGTAQKVRDLERKEEEAARQIYRRLHKTFITPIDPEDIHTLATEIDEILDHLDAAAYRCDAYRLEGKPDGMPEIARSVHECVRATVEALETLNREGVKKPDELTQQCDGIQRRELEIEDRVREAVRNLFAAEHDAIALIKQKEIYEFFESAADGCKNVADVLEAVAVKNS
ncbi:MAG: DUF47 family protein [Bryobacterales bacterium]|nr:DUF47 family protein [Bryobacterales bacterium]